MKYTIQDLAEGKCAVINDGTLEELKEVLEKAFPDDEYTLEGTEKLYFKHQHRENEWQGGSSNNLPTQSVKDFLKEENKKVCLQADNTEATGKKIINYLESLSGENKIQYNGKSNNLYYYIDSLNKVTWAVGIPEGYVLIELPQEEQNSAKEKQDNMKKITYQQAQDIINIACNTWKETLSSKWAKNIVLQKEIEITEAEYKEMRKACTKEQHELFDKIFGTFEIGDWVFVEDGGSGAFGANKFVGQVTTKEKALEQNYRGHSHQVNPCDAKMYVSNGKIAWGLCVGYKVRKATEEEINKVMCPYEKGELIFVRCTENSVWDLRYFSHIENGLLFAFENQKKKGNVIKWKYHAPAKGVVLPE